jgi:hypothetical protein
LTQQRQSQSGQSMQQDDSLLGNYKIWQHSGTNQFYVSQGSNPTAFAGPYTSQNEIPSNIDSSQFIPQSFSQSDLNEIGDWSGSNMGSGSKSQSSVGSSS